MSRGARRLRVHGETGTPSTGGPMRKRRRTAVSRSLSFLVLLCLLLPLRVGRAQQMAEQAGSAAPETGVIAGVVTAQETGVALPEVRVTVLGTSLAATADHDGRFSIAQVPPGTYRLQARLIGYEVGEVPGVVVAAGQTATTNLRLQPLPVALQEVVVVGYGTQHRRDVTSSQSSIPAADLNTTPTVNTVDALQGRAAGVDIVTTGQKPGDGVRVRVRGARSITAGNDPLYVVDGIPAAGVTDLSPNDMASIQAGRSTNWQDLVLRQGQQVNNEIRIAGGDARTRFALSGGQLTQQGILQGQDFTRRSVRLNFNHELNDRLTVGSSASLVRTDQNLGRGDGVYSEALLNNPLAVPFDSAGNLLFKPTPDGQRVNPLSDVQNWIDDRSNTLVSGTLFADYHLTDALSWRVNFGGNVSSNRRGVFQGAQTQVNQGSGADAGLWDNRTTAYTLDNILTFRLNVGSYHRVDVTLLYSIQEQRTEDDSLHATGLPYERQQFYDIGSATHIDGMGSDLTTWALQSYMARVNYAFKDKYLLTLTSRVDGSSRLAPGHKYALFPSVAFAWRLSEEGFIRRTNLFSDLKLRASYGHTGNTAIDPYQTLGSLTRVPYAFDNNASLGYRPGTLPNPNLKWENTGQLDVGLEFTALRGRLSGSVDYYRADTKDLIMRRQIPPTNGYTSILQNIGSTRNTGLEVALSVVPIEDWHGLRWSQDLNWSTNHNRIVSLYGGVNDVLNKWFIGQPIDVYYDNKFVGIWQAQDSLLAKQYKAKPGQIRVADVNGDGKIDGNDRVILGTPFPAWTGSMTSRFDWKRFDLSLMTVARVDFMANDQFVVGESTMQGRYNNLVTNYWTPTNPSNTESRPTANQENPPFGDTRRYEDGSFVRVRSITLGYTLPAVHGGPWHARSLRLYVTALDPFLFTRFRGLDPESRTGTGDRTSAGYAEAAATPSSWTR